MEHSTSGHSPPVQTSSCGWREGMNARAGGIVELRIDSLAFGGEGIARRGGLVYFVENALPGERVEARVKSLGKNFVRAQSVRILDRSPDREEPFCRYYSTCGGCVLQHLGYEKQLEAKKRMLEDILRHLGGFRDIQVEPVIASPKSRNYRNHITLLSNERERDLRFGFIAKDNHTLLEIEECPIADTRINMLFPALRERIGKLPPFKKARLRKVILRVGSEGKAKEGWVQKGTPGVVPERDLVAWVEGLPFYYSMDAFFQTNYFILPRLIHVLKDLLRPSGKEMLLDLYAGVGFFSVLLASGYREVIGIEEGRRAVHDARNNFEKNKVANARILSGKVESELRNLRGRLRPPLHVILDPPRIGAAKPVIDFLAFTPIERMVYISCEPSILARDLRQLSRSFKVKRVVPLDMFPHTKHLETLVLLERH